MTQNIQYAIVGGLREDYFITPDGEAHLGVPGGNAAFAAVGARIWTSGVALVARVGSNYPREWLERLTAHGLETHNVKVGPEPLLTRTFYAYVSHDERTDADPASHFARLGQPLPPALADYHTSMPGQESRTRFSALAVRPSDLLKSTLAAQAFHLSPMDYITHRTLPETLRRAGVRLVTLDPSIRYMQPAFHDVLQTVISGLDAFLPSQVEVRSYFRDEVPDLWEAATALGDMGAKIVVVKLGARGQYVYHVESRQRWHVPAYPVNVRDVTGAGDAYCGGFLVGLAQTSDPVEASLRGAVSASLVVEGVGVLYALEVTPGLAEARLNSLRQSVRRI